MHESSLMRSLLRQVEHVAHENGATKVVGVTITAGEAAAISAEEARFAFHHYALGTIAEGATLVLVTEPGPGSDVRLAGIDVEET